MTEIGSASRENDHETCRSSGVRGTHGVHRFVEYRAIRTRMVDLHVRASVGKSESGRDTASVRWRRNGRGRCR